MRNLKRVLALALALIMMLGMMITASAASYTDEAQIDDVYAEAVDVLSGLEVMRGQGNGFAPDAEIMRSEVAAIIYRIATKDVKDKQAGIYADYAKFNDVDANAWYAGYVGYCANATYLKGYNGNVDPTGLVTGYQALAMILRVMGYDQNGEFEGAGWDIRTASTAQKLGILKNINTSTLGLPATRETVAEMVFQAMQCSKVDYTLAFGYQETGVSLMDDFGAVKLAGIITDTTLADGETTFADAYTVETAGTWPWSTPTTSKIDITVSNTDADWQKVGYAAYVWATGLKEAKKTAKAITDIVITGETLSVTTDGTTIAAMTANKKLPSYVAACDTTVAEYVNGEVGNVVPAIGTKVALVDNDGNGKVDAIIATEYTAAVITNVLKISETGVVSDYSYTATGLGGVSATILPEQLIGVDALAKDDVITYVAINDDDAAKKTAIDYYYVTMAGTDTADFTAITWETVGGAKVETYTIGGNDYVASERVNAVNYADLKAANLNETVVFTTDEYGYILTADVYEDPAAYLLVLDNEDSHGIKNVAETEVAYTDGTVAEIEVACKGDVEDGVLALGDIYTYTVNKAGYTELIDVADVNAVDTYVDNSVTFNGVKVNNRTTFVDLRDVLKGKAEVGTVYNGYLDLPGITNAEIVYTVKNGAMSLCYIVGGTNTSDLTASFVVFNTDINVQTATKVGQKTTYTYTLKAGVITGNELVANYELTEDQYAAINTYGVGAYEFGVDGKLKSYTSFEADSVVWTPETNGTVVYKGIDVTDAYSLHFLDISKGKYHSWDQYVLNGEYYAVVNAQKKIAYIVADATIGATESILANAADKGAVVYGDEATEDAYAGLIYTVVDYKVTDVEAPVVVPTYSITIKNYAEGMGYQLVGSEGQAVDPAKVTAGTYHLHVKALPGYDNTTAVIYVGNDTIEMEQVGGNPQYNIVVTNADVIVEIHGEVEINEYTVKYNADNGAANPADDVVTVKTTDVTLPTVEKAGYKFLGWFDEADKLVESLTQYKGLTGTQTLTAKWEANEYTLTVKYFNAAGQLVNTWNTTEKAGTEYVVALAGVAEIEGKLYDAAAGYPVAIVDEDVVVVVKYVDEFDVVAAQWVPETPNKADVNAAMAAMFAGGSVSGGTLTKEAIVEWNADSMTLTIDKTSGDFNYYVDFAQGTWGGTSVPVAVANSVGTDANWGGYVVIWVDLNGSAVAASSGSFEITLAYT